MDLDTGLGGEYLMVKVDNMRKGQEITLIEKFHIETV